MTLWVLVAFFLTTDGMGHFEISKDAFTTIAQCDALGEKIIDDLSMNPDIMEAWGKCMPIGGTTA